VSPTDGPGLDDGAGSAPIRLDACREHLAHAIDAARSLGLDVAEAERVRSETIERLGLSAELYVLALVGGTGVGKSSLLNAIAGTAVSPAGARRPTTEHPVAWIPVTSAEEDVASILGRIGIVERRTHADAGLRNVVILDLPDMDSVAAAHRERVEALLPKVDAVAWITDPEKYADALLHDAFLRRWVPRLDRQLVVINKADRLDGDGRRAVERDMARTLDRELASARTASPAVLLTTALDGHAGVAPLRDWLGQAVDAKVVVARRLARAAVAAIEHLAIEAGADPDGEPRPMLPEGERRAAIDAAVLETLRLVDLAGARRQAVAATRAAARPRGAGPLGHLTSFVYRTSGRQRRVADPATYLAQWRERGTLARPAEPLRAAGTRAVRIATPPLRPALAAAADAGAVADRLGTATDLAIARHGDLPAPTSRLWSLLGLLQTVNLALLVFATAWLVVWLVARPPVDSVDLPVLGLVPVPFALLALGIAAGFVLARILALHAGWIGSRWAARIAADVRASVESAVAEEAFAGIDRIEQAQQQLRGAARGSREACGGPRPA
jgi:energy-coupling factor transporter ATP-binding protein EcfA2